MHKAGRDPRFVCGGNAKHPTGGNIDVPRIAANCCPTNMHIVRVQRSFLKLQVHTAHASVLEDFSFFQTGCIVVVFKGVFKYMLGSVKFYKKCLDETFQSK